MQQEGCGALAAVAAVAAALGGFGTFGAALWANIHVDGDAGATTIETLLAISPLVFAFLAPAFVMATVGRLTRSRPTQRAFGIAGAASVTLLTVGYALVPIAFLAAACCAVLWVRRRPIVLPLDLIMVATFVAMIWYFAYAESHR